MIIRQSEKIELMQSNKVPETDPGLRLTDTATSHIKASLKLSVKKALGIRISVKKAGCSGYEYVLEYTYDKPKEHDFVFEYDEFCIVIDQEIYMKFFKGGTIIDFKEEGLKQGLHFDNPNVANQCGCGESFTLVNEQ